MRKNMDVRTHVDTRNNSTIINEILIRFCVFVDP